MSKAPIKNGERHLRNGGIAVRAIVINKDVAQSARGLIRCTAPGPSDTIEGISSRSLPKYPVEYTDVVTDSSEGLPATWMNMLCSSRGLRIVRVW